MADDVQQPPRKSSNEILSELFGAFNAEPPPIVIETDISTSNVLSCENKTEKSHKKHKKRHKKLKKKKKKTNDKDNDNDNGGECSKQKSKKNKRHRSKDVKGKSEVLSDSNQVDEVGNDNSKNSIKKSKSKEKHKKNKKLSDKKADLDRKPDVILSSITESSSSETEEKTKDSIVKSSNKTLKKRKNISRPISCITLDSDTESITEKKSNESADILTKLNESSIKDSTIEVLSSENKITCENKKLNPVFRDSLQLADIKMPATILIKEETKGTIGTTEGSNCIETSDKKEIDISCSVSDNTKCDSDKVIKGVANAFVEDCLESGVKPEKAVSEKRKFNLGGINKIMIKNLKNSTVFEETVRQVEEQARLKAEKYEEGEISDDSTNNEGSKSSSRSISPVALSPSSLSIIPKITVENKLKSPSRKMSSEKGHSSSHHSRNYRKSSAAGSTGSSHKRDGSCKRSHKSRDKRKSSKRKSRSKSPSNRRSRSKKRSHSRSKSKEKHKGDSESHTRKKHRSSSHKHRHNHHHHTSRRKSSASPSDRDYYRSSRSYRKRYSKSKSRSRSRSRTRSRSPYSKDRRQDGQEKIDKQRLLEIARKNALNMLKQSNSSGGGPVNVSGTGVEQTKATIAAGGKTVDELTDFCKLLSKKDAEGHESISSNTSNSSDSESEKPFHHPFQIKDRPQSIVMNIRNSVAVPLKTLQEKTAEQSKALRLQFPVSSGQLHRKKESDWVPVSPKRERDQSHHFGFGHNSTGTSSNVATAVVQPMPVQVAYPSPNAMVPPSLGSPVVPPLLSQVPLPPNAPGQPITYPPPLPPEQMYGGNIQFGGPQGFEEQSNNGAGLSADITSAVAHRLSAMKRLQQNPNDVEAIIEMNKAQQEVASIAKVFSTVGHGMVDFDSIKNPDTGNQTQDLCDGKQLILAVTLPQRLSKAQAWVQSKYEPGHFTGTTGARVLSQAELAAGTQAWARRDQLSTAAPVQSGMGMALLQKMGWRPGEGLGKNKEGTLEPLKLQVKMDKKGLVASDEVGYNPMQPKSVAKNFYEGKHPVSLLNELCSRKRYGPPIFDCCFETGPDHKKNFIFKVVVNNVEYKPSVPSQNKKQAKVEAATLCLKALGVLH